MKNTAKFTIIIALCLIVPILAMGIGSVYIPPIQVIRAFLSKLPSLHIGSVALLPGVHFNQTDLPQVAQTIVWKLRFPRVLLSFLSGAALSVSGVVMQSVLRNPLASSYTLGVSSGAAVGASIVMIFGISFIGAFTLPLVGLLFGLLTVFLAVSMASRMDKSLDNTTIVLTGMAFTLFASSIITFLMMVSHEDAVRIVYWQMGSFALKDISYSLILLPVVAIGLAVLLFFSREMDLMTFGEEQAKASGVEIKKIKWLLLSISAIITGFTVSIVGIIGFVDLFTPHVARRLFGSRHKPVLVASALLGGLFMVACDLIARSLVPPIELPVGAVTSAIGAPFFIYLYYNRKKGQKS